MAIVKFYLRNTTITVSVTDWGGPRIQKSTGEKCSPTDWQKSTDRVKKIAKHSLLINDTLDAIDANLKKYFSDCRHAKVLPEQEQIEIFITGKQKKSGPDLYRYLDEFVAASTTGSRTAADGRPVSALTLKSYRNAFTCLREFTPDIPVQKVNEDFIRQWQKWQWEEKENFDNYVGRNAKVLNTFSSWLYKTKEIKLPRARVWREEISIVVVYPDEIKELAYWEPSTERDRYTRDMFLLGCMTCLRVSNLLSLGPDNILNTPDGMFINVIQVKTEKPLQIKLHPIAAAIVNDRLQTYGDRLFNNVTDQELNRRLKDMAKTFGRHLEEKRKRTSNAWQGSVTRVRYRAGRAIQYKMPFWKMISTHTMRRTGITSLLILGVPEIVVRKVSGHSPNSKDFSKYVKFAQKHIGTITDEAWGKAF